MDHSNTRLSSQLDRNPGMSLVLLLVLSTGLGLPEVQVLRSLDITVFYERALDMR